MLCALLLKILKWRVQQVEKQNLRREERKPGECGRGMRGAVRIEEDRVDMEEEVQGEHEQVSHLYHRMSAVWVDLWHAPAAAESLLTAYFRHPFPNFPNFTILTKVPSPYLLYLQSRALTGEIPSRGPREISFRQLCSHALEPCCQDTQQAQGTFGIHWCTAPLALQVLHAQLERSRIRFLSVHLDILCSLNPKQHGCVLLLYN